MIYHDSGIEVVFYSRYSYLLNLGIDVYVGLYPKPAATRVVGLPDR
jgi:hypothetical protein